MILSATWDSAPRSAQGEVTPDRYELDREGALIDFTAGRKDHQVGCVHHGGGESARLVARSMISEPCLSEAQAVELGALLRQVENLMDMPVEIEWAMDDAGFNCFRAARCILSQQLCPTQSG